MNYMLHYGICELLTKVVIKTGKILEPNNIEIYEI